MKQDQGKRTLHKKIAVGYLIIVLLIGGTVCTYLYEWNRMQTLEKESGDIRCLRNDILEAYAKLVDLSFVSEAVMEWDDADLQTYHTLRLELDSLLCHLKKYDRSHRIDSVRLLLETKEDLFYQISRAIMRQEEANRQIAQQVPAIVQQIGKEPEKTKRGGFLGLFRRKEKNAAPTSTALLRSLNKNLVLQQQRETERLAAFVDSLISRNSQLNPQLKTLISHLNRQAQTGLQSKDEKIAATRENSFLIMSLLLAAVFLLLVVSYIFLLKDEKRITRFKRNTQELIGKLQFSLGKNEELLKARRKIMLTISHELRTPLTAISGNAEMILKDPDGGNRLRYAQAVQQSAGRMIALLNSLLDFFRLDNGKEEVKPVLFHLRTITDVLENEFSTQADAKGITLEVAPCTDTVVYGDRNRILQIGNNLLSNAFKFTEKGTVKLVASYRKGTYTLTVSDTGTGISAEQQNAIFAPFERLSNAATQDGFGLGLAIVKNLLQLLGGKISMESAEGQGSTFTVTLPLREADGIREKQPLPVLAERLQPCSILALDNDEVILAMTRDMFSYYGLSCDTCNNVRDLMEMMRSKNYDLLITDLKMPLMNGYEVRQLLRSSNVANSRTIPILVMTASGSCREEQLLADGFSGCLFKPFSSSELMDAVKKCIGDMPEETPDLHPLLAYEQDKASMLQKLIAETRKEMQKIAEALLKEDKDELDEWAHHLHSSWAVIRADRPLQRLSGTLRDEAATREDLRGAVEAVLRQGEEIIRLARQMAEEYGKGHSG